MRAQIRDYFQYLGQEFKYDNFIFFVRNEIAPYMELEFVEEPKLREMFDLIINNQYSAQQIHRGFGKSEMGIWLVCYIVCCRPFNPYSGKRMTEGMIVTSADDALNTLSARIKHYFYENPRMRAYLPYEIKKIQDEKKNTYWNKSELYFNNGVMVHLRTIMSKSIRGNHNDWVWGDDLVGDNSAVVDKKIEDVWFGAVDGTTTSKDALSFVTGTPKRATDVMEKMNSAEGYVFAKYPIFNEKNELISDRWNLERATQTKKRIGSVMWQCEYMLDPIDDSTSLIKREWIKQCQSGKFKIERQRPEWATAVYLGVDFAFSDRITADKSVFWIFGEYYIDDKRYFVLLDYITKKGKSGREQMDIVNELHQSYKFDLIGLEENSIKAITREIKKDYGHLPIKRFWTGNRDEKEETEGFKEFTTVSKRNLILRLGTAMENIQIILPVGDEESKKKVEDFTTECISFAQEEGKLVEIGPHPDIPIAAAYAYEVATRWSGGFLI
ncbi:hypothetical protein K9M79_03020 [Candidatus Woesearchaeota archaeon]|nr:hypothetical protein [Candidatus Woesearchaeota archaeon]